MGGWGLNGILLGADGNPFDPRQGRFQTRRKVAPKSEINGGFSVGSEVDRIHPPVIERGTIQVLCFTLMFL